MQSVTGGSGWKAPIVFGPGNDAFELYSGDNTIQGGDGNDTLTQSGGPSVLLDGGNGDDMLDALFGVTPGSATVIGGAGNDHIQVSATTATVDAGAGDDRVIAVWGTATITLGSGADLVSPLTDYQGRSVTITDFQTGSGGDAIIIDEDFLVGWDGAANPFQAGYYRLVQRGGDTVLQYDEDGASGFATFIDLATFQNTLVSQFTNDNVYRWVINGVQPVGFGGTAAADIYNGTASDETIEGHGGSDSLNGGGGNDSLFGGEGDDHLTDDRGSSYIRGGNGDDWLRAGDAGFQDLHGNAGNDTVTGGNDGDWVVGGQGNDVLRGAAGGDVVYGNLGNDTQYGDDGNDWVRGGQGDDSVSAGAGDDFVAGDRGNDTIGGGAGADTFHSFSGAGLDRIADFNAAEGDRLNLLVGTTYTLRQDGADTVVDMGGGDQAVLVGVQLSALPAGWIFVG